MLSEHEVDEWFLLKRREGISNKDISEHTGIHESEISRMFTHTRMPPEYKQDMIISCIKKLIKARSLPKRPASK